MAYTTTDFLNAVERRSFAPANQLTFSSTDILALGDETIQEKIVPAILAAREEYYVTYVDLPLVDGQSIYEIPPRAIGSIIREPFMIDTANNIYALYRTSMDRLHLYGSASAFPDKFYFMGENIVLNPVPTGSGIADKVLRLYYQIRPGQLVDPSAAAVISAIDTVGLTVTVSSIPLAWVTGNVFDLISANGSQRYFFQGTDLTSSLISGNIITLPSIPQDLQVGDYVSIAGTSPLVQMPAEFRPAFAMLTAAIIIGSQNQPNGDSLLQKGLDSLKVAQDLIKPRSIGEEETIIPDWS